MRPVGQSCAVRESRQDFSLLWDDKAAFQNTSPYECGYRPLLEWAWSPHPAPSPHHAPSPHTAFLPVPRHHPAPFPAPTPPFCIFWECLAER